MLAWLLKLLKPNGERRDSARRSDLNLFACYFNGGSGARYPVRDIGEDGAYIETSCAWAIGTLMRFTLNTDASGDDEGNAIMLHAEVVRTTPDGMAVRFLFHSYKGRRSLLRFLDRVAKGQRASPVLP